MRWLERLETLFIIISICSIRSVYAAATPTPTVLSVVCVAGQCVEGYTNITYGAQLVANNHPQLTLLPGTYAPNVNPQLLHDALTANGATLTAQAGFNTTSTISLPLTISLQPGIAGYASSLFSGQPTFVPLSTTSSSSNGTGNTSTTLNARSFGISDNTWAAIQTSDNSRVIVWSSIPDVGQLASSIASSSSFSILDVQSASCSSPCSSGGTCTLSTNSSQSTQCVCKPGFTDPACSSCSPGFFGPSCTPCPTNCTTCDDGLTGSGICLVPSTSNAPSTCSCLNGVCDGSGGCTCNTGWTTAANGTSCAQCSPGFFLNSATNSCEACQLGCSSCSPGVGNCLNCASGFQPDANDRTKCAPNPSTPACADGSFASNGTCTQCSPLCKTCNGATGADCIVCASGSFKLPASSNSATCAQADGNGICAGTKLVGNSAKGLCDACPATCTACQIPNFTPFSLFSAVKCTGCLPGLVLNPDGQCVDRCPSGTFLSEDNLTCQPCSSTCSTCAGSASFCLSCSASGQLASGGKCVTSCPTTSFASGNGTCTSCHPDCATCTGQGVNQCSSCPPTRPVLTAGRCVSTCSQSEYFDTASGSCKPCDGSCSSCSGPGSGNCLACADNAKNVLKGGSCVAASCNAGSSVVPSLGVCLSDLVFVPTASSGAPPMPTFSGITTPTTNTATTTKRPLAWWEILLMVLGCCFIFFAFLFCWRRRARKLRAKETQAFARKKNLDPSIGWWGRVRGLFSRKTGGIHLKDGNSDDGASVKTWSSSGSSEREREKRRKIERELARHDLEMGNLGAPSSRGSSRQGSPTRSSKRSQQQQLRRPEFPRPHSRLSSMHTYEPGPGQQQRYMDEGDEDESSYEPSHYQRPSSWLPASSKSLPSIYSSLTTRGKDSQHNNIPPRVPTPEPKTTVKHADLDDLIDSYRASIGKHPATMTTAELIDFNAGVGVGGSPAESYMRQVMGSNAGLTGLASNQETSYPPFQPSQPSYWLTPTPTGGSTSTNPFRR